jgi:hypothetical protein
VDCCQKEPFFHERRFLTRLLPGYLTSLFHGIYLFSYLIIGIKIFTSLDRPNWLVMLRKCWLDIRPHVLQIISKECSGWTDTLLCSGLHVIHFATAGRLLSYSVRFQITQLWNNIIFRTLQSVWEMYYRLSLHVLPERKMLFTVNSKLKVSATVKT